MPSQLLSSLTGGAGGFVPDTISATVSIASGVTGTLATITPPSGKKAALTLLAVSTGSQTGISVEVAASTVIAANTLTTITGATAANTYAIGSGVPASVFKYVIAPLPDQAITITKDAGNTSQSIFYAYAYGD